MRDMRRANAITAVKNEMFVEAIKGLFLMNGGGAISLATWLQAVWEKNWAAPMLEWHLWGMAMFGLGVFFAGTSFLARFLAFYHPRARFPRQNPIWWGHTATSVASVLAFAIGIFLVVRGGFAALRCP